MKQLLKITRPDKFLGLPLQIGTQVFLEAYSHIDYYVDSAIYIRRTNKVLDALIYDNIKGVSDRISIYICYFGLQKDGLPLYKLYPEVFKGDII